MRPDFALTLAPEGLQLLARAAADGWKIVGEVPLETPGMDSRLAALRARAEAVADGRPFLTKILLPNAQIRYIALDTTRAGDDAILAAVAEATPYALGDVAWDVSVGGGRTYIAIVARETLAEAEAFAITHNLSPASFAAVPEPFTFMGEAFFGATELARREGFEVARDAEALVVTGWLEPEVEPPVPSAAAEAASHMPDAEPPEPVIPLRSAASIAGDSAAADRALSGPGFVSRFGGSRVTAPVDGLSNQSDHAPAPETSPPAGRIAISPEPATMAATATAEPGFSSRRTVQDSQEATVAADREDTPSGGEVAAPDTGSDAMVDAAGVGADVAAPTQHPVGFASRRSGAEAAAPDGSAAPDVTAPDAAAEDEQTEPAAPTGTPEPGAPVFTSRLADFRAERDTADGAAPPAPAVEPRPDPAFVTRRETTQPRRTEPPPLSIPPAADPPDPAPADRPTAVSDEIAEPKPESTAPPDISDPAPLAVPRAADLPEIDTPAIAAPQDVAPASAAPMTDLIAEPAPMPDDVPPVTGQSESALPEANAPPPPDPITRIRPAPDDTPAGGFLSRRKPAPAAAAPAGEERDRMTVFGARRRSPAPTARGKPRYLGLILTAILLLFMAAVAALAALNENGLAGWFAPRDQVPPTEVAAVPPDTPAVVPVAVPEPPAEDPAPDPLAGDDVAALVGQILSPAEAERIYAATGVWQRAPRLPLTPQVGTLEGLTLAAAAGTLPRRGLPDLPSEGRLRPDLPAVSPPPPPPPGVAFERDARGFILATPEGTLSPEGILIFAGSPALLPPARPGTVSPIVEALRGDPFVADPTLAAFRPRLRPDALAPTPGPGEEPAAVVEAVPGAEPAALPVPETAPDGPEETVSGPLPGADPGAALATPDPALAGVQPLARPGGVAPGPEVEEAAPPVADPALAGFRPQARPAAPQEAALPPPDPALAGIRPRIRPAGLVPAEPEEDTAAEPLVDQNAVAAASLAAVIESTLEEAQRNAPVLENATAQAIAISARPDARPRNFARIVDRARRAAAQEETRVAAAAVPTRQAAAPTAPTPRSAAQAATLENEINLRRINLIGVYGSQSDRRALVRLANGRYVKVSVGDRLDGGRVAAIGADFIDYTRRNRTTRLEVPGS